MCPTAFAETSEIRPDGFELLYEVGPCVAVNKPAGLLTQAVPGIDSLEVRLKSFLKQRDQKTGNVYLGVPHRLDRCATGAMVFAKHVRAARRLCDQFAARTVRKVYWVAVDGLVEKLADTWVDHIRKIPDEARAEIASETDAGAKLAVLHYRVLAEFEFGSLLEIELETGRTHQVRVQAAAHGFTILGDHLYGSKTDFGPPSEDPRMRAIGLHARSLEFRHPMTREPVCVIAALPKHWPDVVREVME